MASPRGLNGALHSREVFTGSRRTEKLKALTVFKQGKTLRSIFKRLNLTMKEDLDNAKGRRTSQMLEMNKTDVCGVMR